MKWKINIRKEVKVAAALVGVSILIAFSERNQGGTTCKDIVIELDNVEDNHFMDEAEVMRLVELYNPNLKGSAIDRLDLRTIEGKLTYDKHIREAQLYSDLKGNLVVNVELRRPIARIVQEDGPDAYVAEDGTIMPVSDKFTSRVLVISGDYMHTLLEHGNLLATPEGTQLMDLIRTVIDDDFWKAQLAQLDMDAQGRIVMYPQVTGQRIEFGHVENVPTKLKKLMIFYKEILPQRGWTRYKRVNLEYEGQVVAE